MFKKSAEQQIMRGADRLVSMKEDIDALSWGRVTEIAKLLQGEHTDEQRQEWARELLSIARANSWVLDKFGVAADDMTGNVIPSGIEVQQNDHYLSETTAAEIPSAGEVPAPVEPVAEDVHAETIASVAESPAIPAEADSAAGDAGPCEPSADSDSEATGEIPRIPVLDLPSIEIEIPIGSSDDAEAELRALEALYDELVAQNAEASRSEQTPCQSAQEQQPKEQPEARSQVPHPASVRDPQPQLQVEQIVQTQPHAQVEAEAGIRSERRAMGDDTVIETKGVLKKKRRLDKQKRRDKRDAAIFSIPMGKPVDEPCLSDQGEAVASNGSSLPEAAVSACVEPEGAAVREPVRYEGAAAVASEPVEQVDPAEEVEPYREGQTAAEFARFRHVFSNKKGSLCLYEDADGHLVAVDPARFA